MDRTLHSSALQLLSSQPTARATPTSATENARRTLSPSRLFSTPRVRAHTGTPLCPHFAIGRSFRPLPFASSHDSVGRRSPWDPLPPRPTPVPQPGPFLAASGFGPATPPVAPPRPRPRARPAVRPWPAVRPPPLAGGPAPRRRFRCGPRPGCGPRLRRTPRRSCRAGA